MRNEGHEEVVVHKINGVVGQIAPFGYGLSAN